MVLPASGHNINLVEVCLLRIQWILPRTEEVEALCD